jgi:hypothetical protein
LKHWHGAVEPRSPEDVSVVVRISCLLKIASREAETLFIVTSREREYAEAKIYRQPLMIWPWHVSLEHLMFDLFSVQKCKA